MKAKPWALAVLLLATLPAVGAGTLGRITFNGVLFSPPCTLSMRANGDVGASCWCGNEYVQGRIGTSNSAQGKRLGRLKSILSYGAPVYVKGGKIVKLKYM